MNFGQAIQSGFKNYIGFEGRACRSEYWFWVLFTVLAGFATAIIDAVLFSGSEPSPLNVLFNLAVLLPSIAVGARRLHDIDKTGWRLLLWLVPIVGWIILILWAVQKGDGASNRFGSDPLAASAAA